MAKVTYSPPEGEAQSVTWGGKKFEAGKAVDIDNPAMLAKAQNNPHFKVAGSKEEARRAEVVGGYADANTGEEVELIRKPRNFNYGTLDTGLSGPVPPSAATQGSTAIEASRPSMAPNPGNFEEVYGAPPDVVATGEYEGAPEYIGPEGTEGTSAKRGRPAGSKNKK